MQASEVSIVIGAITALIVAIAGVFFAYLKTVTKADRDERIATAKINSDALKLVAKAITDLENSSKEQTKSGVRQALAQERTADEAKERNGHIVEVITESRRESIKDRKALAKMIDRNYNAVQDAVKDIVTQHVDTQIVDNQTVKK